MQRLLDSIAANPIVAILGALIIALQIAQTALDRTVPAEGARLIAYKLDETIKAMGSTNDKLDAYIRANEERVRLLENRVLVLEHAR